MNSPSKGFHLLSVLLNSFLQLFQGLRLWSSLQQRRGLSLHSWLVYSWNAWMVGRSWLAYYRRSITKTSQFLHLQFTIEIRFTNTEYHDCELLALTCQLVHVRVVRRWWLLQNKSVIENQVNPVSKVVSPVVVSGFQRYSCPFNQYKRYTGKSSVIRNTKTQTGDTTSFTGDNCIRWEDSSAKGCFIMFELSAQYIDNSLFIWVL